MDDAILDSLYHKFSELFKNIQQIQSRRTLVQDEIDHFRSIVQEQDNEDDSISDQEDEEDYEYKILLAQQQCKALQDKKREIDRKVREENNIKNQLYSHIENIQNEIQQMAHACEQQQESQEQFQERINEAATKIDEYQLKIQKSQTALQAIEDQVTQQVDRNFQENEKLRNIQVEVRQGLQGNAMFDKRIAELEKIIQKQWEELNKRTSRIQVLQNNQNILMNKIQKSIKSESIYHKIKEENTSLAQENVQIREKLNQLINAIPAHMRKSQHKEKELYDDTICQNELKIRNLERLKDINKKNLGMLNNEVQQLEEKYNQMTSNIKVVQEQYFQMEKSLKFDEEEYARTNCPNYYKVKKTK